MHLNNRVFVTTTLVEYLHSRPKPTRIEPIIGLHFKVGFIIACKVADSNKHSSLQRYIINDYYIVQALGLFYRHLLA